MADSSDLLYRKLASDITADHQRRANALGGTVSVAASSGIWMLVYQLLRSGVWDLVYDMGVFAGVGNLNGCLAKIKYPVGVSSSLTNSGFASGDVTASGIKSTGTQYLDTGVVPRNMRSFGWGHGVLLTETGSSTGYQTPLGCADSTTITNHIRIRGGGTLNPLSSIGGQSTSAGLAGEAVVSIHVGSRTSATSNKYYRNGVLKTTVATSDTALNTATKTCYIGQVNVAPATINSGFFLGRIGAYFLSAPLSDNQARYVSDAINTYARNFGLNTY